jgi:transmembrane sensor
MRAAREASRWLALLQAGELSMEERAEFIDWLRESPVHVAEMLHVCRQHRDLSTFTRWAQIAGSASDAPGGLVVPFPRPEAGSPNTAAPGTRYRRMVMAAVACVALLGIISVFFALDFDQIKIRTQIGERREVTLVDGSVVDLAPNSYLQVRFAKKERFVALESGEALFQVAKNAERPFIVEAGDTRVRAVGTAFSVERESAGVSITVVEGKVKITQTPSLARRAQLTTGADPTELFLGANEQVVVSSTRGAAPVRQVKAEVEIAWANGNLIFDNESVGRIVERFNSYNRLQIRVTDPGVTQRKVSGMFRASDPESFVAFIESEVGISVQREPDVIILGAASKTPH